MANEIPTVHDQLRALETMIALAEQQGLGEMVLLPLRKQIEEIQQSITSGDAGQQLPVQGNVTITDGTVGTVVGVNMGVINSYNTITTQHAANPHKHRAQYLKRLLTTLNRLPLPGLDPNFDRHGQDIRLPEVYVTLATQDRISVFTGPPEEAKHFFERDDTTAPLRPEYHPDFALPEHAIIHIAYGTSPIAMPLTRSTEAQTMTLERSRLVMESMNLHRQIIILGGPGSGKSTFLRHLAWTSAYEELHRADDQGNYGTTVYSVCHFGLPILIMAKQLAQQIHIEGVSIRAMVTVLKASVQHEIITAIDIDDMLTDALETDRLLVMIDGLDEVPVTATLHSISRRDTLTCIRDFARSYPQLHVVVTCRERAFDADSAALLGWPTQTLVPLTLGQIKQFVPAWFNELAQIGAISHEQIHSLSVLLCDSIASQPHLRMLAEVPLLLTMMGLVLYHDGILPRDRPLLYDRVMNLMLGLWDNARSGESLGQAIGMPSFQSAQLRPLLQKLAFNAHSDASSADGRGRLSRSDIREAMINFFEDMAVPHPWECARRCIEYLDQRSGMFVPDRENDFVFTHLTLQEYAAGCHLVHRPDAVDTLMKYRHDDRWRESLMLGLGSIQSSHPSLIADFLVRLIAPKQEGVKKPRKRWYRDLILAAEIGTDRDWIQLQGQKLDISNVQEAIRDGLAQMLNNPAQPLNINERTRAGFLLGDLGDPRYPVTITDWKKAIKRVYRDDSSGYFCKVDAGTYWIGSAPDDRNADPWERPRQLIRIAKPFWISRYPITNVQWQAWPENARRQLGKRDPDRTRPNQPVGQVSWDDIHAWCDWIQQETGVIVDLPTALEWELAARGPQGTIYPWSNRWRDDRAAIGEADLRMRHSPYAPPVGCYPAGAAACGAMDMAGAIWEWTGSFVPYATLRALGVPEQRLFMFPSTLTPQQRDAVQFCAIKGGAPTYIEKCARAAATIFWNNINLISTSDRGFRIVIRQT